MYTCTHTYVYIYIQTYGYISRLYCRYTCSNRVLSLLRERGLGNSATQINKKIREQHAEDWLRRTTCYLSACLPFSTSQLVRYVADAPPAMPNLPQLRWLMTVFVKDVYTRLDDIKAKVTSTYGDVLKMDSTKKVGTSNIYFRRCLHVFTACKCMFSVHVFSACMYSHLCTAMTFAFFRR